MSGALQIGDRIRISGGHEHEPSWYGPRKERIGSLQRFIPGQNEELAAVVVLDEPVTFDGLEATTVVLELRYVGARWKEVETVHIELCDFEPEPKPWKERRRGKWIESHATYSRVKP